MRISILFHTVNFCGDHAQDMAVALKTIEGETVEQLVERCGFGKNSYAGAGERIELRVEQEKP